MAHSPSETKPKIVNLDPVALVVSASSVVTSRNLKSFAEQLQAIAKRIDDKTKDEKVRVELMFNGADAATEFFTTVGGTAATSESSVTVTVETAEAD